MRHDLADSKTPSFPDAPVTTSRILIVAVLSWSHIVLVSVFVPSFQGGPGRSFQKPGEQISTPK